MLRWLERVGRWPLTTPLLLCGMASLLANLGCHLLLAASLVAPMGIALEALRLNRAWVYLLLRREELALEAAQSLLVEHPEGGLGAYQRLAAAAALLRLRRTLQAKAVLAQVDPADLSEGARPGFFLLMGVLYVRLGDAPGVASMALAASSAADPETASTTMLASVENLLSVGLLLEGKVDEAARHLEGVSLEGVGRETRAVILHNRAWYELRRGGDAEQALEWARQAVRQNPSEPTFQGTLGAALLEVGMDPEMAARCLDRALLVVEDMAPQERVHLLDYAAQAHLEIGDEAGARALAGRLGDIPGGGRPLVALPDGRGVGTPGAS